MEQLVHRSNYEREVTREVLMKLAKVFSADCEKHYALKARFEFLVA